MTNLLKLFSGFLKDEYLPSFKSIDFSQLNTINEDIFSDIYHSNKEGLIIKQFLSVEEIKLFKENFSAQVNSNPTLVDEKYIYEDLVGFTFGKTIIDCKDLTLYKENAKEYNHLEKNIYGFSLNNRVINFLEQISNQTKSTIYKFNDDAEAMGHSIRNFNKKARGIFNHSDQITHKKRPHLHELMNCIDDTTILSFFAVIQKPEKGGNLKIFNDYYRNLPEKIKKEFDTNYKKVESYVNTLQSSIVDLKEGDLIIFDAGQQWHQVEPIHGEIDRITVGGFCGYSKDKKSIYFWS